MNSKCSFKSCPAQEGIVLVTSAGGHTGKPTIMALKKKGYVVHAGVRNVLKANDQLKDVNADSIVYLDLSDSNTIKDLLKSTMYEAVIVIPPGVEVNAAAR